ncbi:MAG TPA: DNA repair protein RecO, partial [Patescibacteria group bacterium]|nr:DNA repair protein RecO [Patescibacteria group bacterium]
TLEAGKIRILGKGTRNPNAKLAGSLEPLTFSEIYISKSRGMGKITGAIVLDNFSSLKSDFDSLAGVFSVFSIIEKIITNEEKDEKIFSLLLNYLKIAESLAAREKKSEKIDILTLGFVFKLLNFSGYGLNMEKCVKCSQKLKPEYNYFSAQYGGVFCCQCANGGAKRISISSGSIKLIRIYLSNKLENFSKISVAGAEIKNADLIAREMVGWIVG